MYFQIGDWIVNSDENSIKNTITQQEKTLQPKEIALLAYFARHEQKVISLGELIEHVWDGRVVSDHAIYQTINKVRKHLDKDNKDAYIRTIQRKGYQLVKSVTSLSENLLHPESSTHINTSALTEDQRQDSVSREALAAENSQLKRTNTFANYLVISLLLATILLLLYRFIIPRAAYLSSNFFVFSQPLTTLLGHEKDPEFTAQGKALVFSHKENSISHYNLFIKNLDDLTERQLTNNSQDDIRASSSADGMKIAFVQQSEQTCLVKLLTIMTDDRMQQQELFSCSDNPHIDIELSPDGETLYYTYADELNPTARVFSLLVKTKKLTQLTNFTIHKALGDRAIALSPDGEKLAILRNDSWRKTSLYTYDLTSNTLEKHFDFDGWIMSIVWGNDTDSLYYLLPRSVSTYSLKHDFHKEVITELSEFIDSFGYSPAKEQIALASGKKSNDIWQHELNDSPNPTRLIQSSLVDFLPRYANHSKSIAFVSTRSGEQQIWLRTASGQERKITAFTDNRKIGNLEWSPDDRFILSSSEHHIYTIDVSTGAETTIIDAGEYSYPALPTWSKDGESIYFTSDKNGDFEIYKTHLASEKTKQVTRNGAAILFENRDKKTAFIIKNNMRGLWEINLSQPDEEILLIPDVSIDDHSRIAFTQDGVYYSPTEQRQLINFLDLANQTTRSVNQYPEGISSFSLSPNNSPNDEDQQLIYAMTLKEETAINLFKK